MIISINKHIQHYVMLVCIGLFALACHKEIKRVSIAQLSTADSILYTGTSLGFLDESTLSLWSDMDIEYDGNLYLSYNIDLYRDSIIVSHKKYDLLHPHIVKHEKKKQTNTNIKRSFTGKMGNILVENPGNYSFRVWLTSNGNTTLKLHKSELVIKK